VRVAKVLEHGGDEPENLLHGLPAFVRLVDRWAREHNIIGERRDCCVEVIGEHRDPERVHDVHAASNASLTSLSASSLCARFTWRYSTLTSCRASAAASSESVRSASFFTRYSPRICLTISSESETTSTSVTCRSTALRSPAIKPLY